MMSKYLDEVVKLRDGTWAAVNNRVAVAFLGKTPEEAVKKLNERFENE